MPVPSANAKPASSCSRSSPRSSAGSTTPDVPRPGTGWVAGVSSCSTTSSPRTDASGCPSRSSTPSVSSSACCPASPRSTPRVWRRPCWGSRRFSPSSSSRPSPGSAASARVCSSRRSRRPSGSTSTRSGWWGSPRTSTPAGSTTTPCCPKGCGTLHPASSPSTRARLDSRHRQLLAAFDTAVTRHRELPARGPSAKQREAAQPVAPALPAHGSAATPTSPRRSGPRASTPPRGGCTARPRSPPRSSRPTSPAPDQEWAMRAASATRDTGRRRRRGGPRAAARPPLRRVHPFRRQPHRLRGPARLRDRRAPRLPHLTGAVRHLPARLVRPTDAVRRAGRVARGGQSRSARSTSGTSSTSRSTSSSRRPRSAASCPTTGSHGPRTNGRGCSEIGEATADRYEAEGRTGHPRLWPTERLRILATLDWMVDDDNAWRARARRPSRRQRAALRHERHRPGRSSACRMAVRSRFRGSADKVDQARDGTILVTDIKTGSSRTFKVLKDDPVAARREAPATRLRHGGAGRPWRARLPRPCPLLVRPPAQGARGGGADPRARRDLRDHRGPARQSASPAGRSHRGPRRPPTSSGCSAPTATPTGSATARSAGPGSASGSAPSSRSSPRSSTA